MPSSSIFSWGLATVVAAAAVGLLHAVLGLANPLLGSSYFTLLFASAFAAALAIIACLGIPVALLFNARGWSGPVAAALAGAVIGVLPYCVFFLINFSPPALADPRMLGMLAGYGAFGAIIFWLCRRAAGRVARS